MSGNICEENNNPEESTRKIEYIKTTVIAIYNKLMNKEILYSFPAKSSNCVSINYKYSPNNFEFSGFASNGALLSKKEWKKLVSKRSWRKLAKVLFLYKDNLDRSFLYASPNKVKEIKHLCEASKYFKVTKDEFYFCKRKDNNGWTANPSLSNKTLGKFHKLTIKLSPKAKIKFAWIYDCKLIILGILFSAFAQIISG